MPKNFKNTGWQKKHLSKLKKYIISKKKYLIQHLYDNFSRNQWVVKKSSSFFSNMAKEVLKDIKACKSKFQKFEKEVYLDYLNLESEFYEFIIFLRKKKQFKKLYPQRKLNDDEFSEKDYNGKKINMLILILIKKIL